MKVNILVTSPLHDETFVQKLTQDLSKSLNRQDDIDSELAMAPTRSGSKGDPITIGTLLVTLLGGGGVIVSLIGVLKSFFDRSKTIEIELERPDGKKLKLKAPDLDKTERALEMVNDFLGD